MEQKTCKADAPKTTISKEFCIACAQYFNYELENEMCEECNIQVPIVRKKIDRLLSSYHKGIITEKELDHELVTIGGLHAKGNKKDTGEGGQTVKRFVLPVRLRD